MQKVEELDSFESVDKNAWDDLVVNSKSARIFQSWRWNEVWWRHFGEGNLLLLTAHEGDRLVGAAPFCEKDGVVSFLGGVDVTDYEDVVVESGYEEEFWRAVFSYPSKKKLTKFDFHFVPPFLGTCDFIQSVSKEFDLEFHFHNEEVAPSLELPASFEDYISSLPRHNRQELRRKMKKLEFNSWGLGKAKDGGDIEDFLNLHRLSDTSKEKFMNERMEGFFREIAKVFYDLGKLDLSYLILDGKRVAANFSFVDKGEILAYNSGLDPDFRDLSVGLLLHAYCIKDAIEKKLTTYDFLRGNERYKYQLGAKDKMLCHVTTIGDIKSI